MGRTRTERTVTATVASSPTPSEAILRASRRSRWVCGRCSIRSPWVSIPSAARPLAVAPEAVSGSASRLGRGNERGPGALSSPSSIGAALAKRVGTLNVEAVIPRA